MDLRQLRHFLAIVDHGGYHRASEQLLISQPSLSQSIAKLERELGVPLFHRTGRGVVLSEAGSDFVGAARTVLRDADAARSTAMRHRGLRAGRLDLITMPSPGIEPLASLVTPFLAEHPQVTINTRAAFVPEEVLRAVRTGEAEIGLAGAREPIKASDLDVRPARSQPLVLVASPVLDTFGPTHSVRRENLAGQRFVASHQGSLMRWLVDDVIAEGIDAQIAVEVSHRTSILPLVLAGVGHAVLPDAWTALAQASGLRVLAINPTVALHVAMISRPSHLTPVAHAFRTMATGLNSARPAAPPTS